MVLWEKILDVILGRIFSCFFLVDKVSVFQICFIWRQVLERVDVWFLFKYLEGLIWEEIFEMGILFFLEDLQQCENIYQNILECVDKFGRYMKNIIIVIRSLFLFEVYMKLV